MPSAFDTTRDCSAAAACMLAKGCKTVIRYYSRSAWKRIDPKEAAALGRAGMQLLPVYQDRQTEPEDFSLAIGRLTGVRAAEYGRFNTYQPVGTAIYFSVDFDVSAKILNDAIVPYFQGLREGMDSVVTGYRIGVYGSGLTNKTLRAEGVAELFWLAQARGWSGYKEFSNSDEWHLRQEMPNGMCGIEGDPNEVNPAYTDIGAFVPSPELVEPNIAVASAVNTSWRKVNARKGLKLRSGAGTEFDALNLLPYDTRVRVLSRKGDWALVDLHGDGAADGFVFAAYLKEA